MKRFRDFVYALQPHALCWISVPLTVAQIILAFVLRQPGSEAVRWVGVILWWTGAVFGWLPIFALRRRGGVPKGKSYVHTTLLVDTGIYAIVRHPQMGTAWLLMSISLILITQHWISIALAIPTMGLVYLDLIRADRRLVEKFGDPYQQYMERVPQTNFVAGIIRLMARRAGA
jgi:protein-S-isoprenylcysteine O-methyltransferase Ste14